MLGEERIPLGKRGLLVFYQDANGRGYLYCQGCHEQRYVGDRLEIRNRGVIAKYLWVFAHLPMFAKLIFPHVYCGREEGGE